jgi:hypothetical protein
MRLPDLEAGEAAWDEAAVAAAVVDMDRGLDAAAACCAAEEDWVEGLFGCDADALAVERDAGVWRKAAKKVERKKGRWEDMVGV